MRVLVDTHIFLWELLGDKRSSKKAIQTLADPDNELLFSMVSLWEIAVLMRLGRLTGLTSSVTYVKDMAGEYGMEILPIRYEHVLALETLPQHHRNPFDRMLIAQGIAEGVPILTRDAQFKAYGVKVLW